jgi:hypothetical protein
MISLRHLILATTFLITAKLGAIGINDTIPSVPGGLGGCGSNTTGGSSAPESKSLD